MIRLAIYGLLTGLALGGWNLLEHTLGYNGHPVGRFSWLITLLLIFLGLLQGIRVFRNQEKGGIISFWEAVFAGAVIALLAGLLQAGFLYGYHVFINPAFVDYLVQKQQQALAAQGGTSAQLAQVGRQIREVYQPLPLALRTLGGCLVVGLIFTLIMASFLKRFAPETHSGATG